MPVAATGPHHSETTLAAADVPPRAGAAAMSAPALDADSGRCVLVAGGAGFIGANLCRQLLARGDRVYCLDNLSTSRRDAIAPFLGDRQFTFLHHDVTIPFATAEPIHQIYNLACPGARAHYRKDPVRTFQTCVAGTRNLLTLARQNQARLVQATDGCAFRTAATADNAPENADAGAAPACPEALDPQACHDDGHRLAEGLCAHAASTHGTEIRIARILHTYGPGMSPGDGRVIPNFIMQALLGAPLTIEGDGRQRRAFLFVDDLIHGLIVLMNHHDTGRRTVSFAAEQTLSVNALAGLVSHRTGTVARMVHRAPVVPVHLAPPRVDLSPARTLLGWSPRVPLSDGLDRTIAHFRIALRKVS